MCLATPSRWWIVEGYDDIQSNKVCTSNNNNTNILLNNTYSSRTLSYKAKEIIHYQK